MSLDARPILSAADATAPPPAPLLPAPGDARQSKRLLRKRMIMMLIASDSLSIYLGFAIAAAIYDVGHPFYWFYMASALLPVYLAVAANGRAFASDVYVTHGLGISRALGGLVTSIGFVTFLAFFLKVGEDYSRGTFAFGSLFALIAIVTVREALVRYSRRAFQGTPYSSVLIADGATPLPMGTFYAVIAGESWLDPGSDSPQMYNRLAVALHDADRVVVACAPERRVAWVRALKGANVRCEVIAPELTDLAPLAISSSSGMPTLVVADGPLGAFGILTKRLFDIVLSLVGLLLLLPTLVMVAIAIKLDSPGPIFFMQDRIGWGNRVFRMIKFRSMRTERLDRSGERLTTRNDDRVTRVGRFIRRTSIDELPQMLNVLIGDMSIVGPRPHPLGAKAATKLYWEIDDRYWHRHAVKPGLTGLAQVRGFRGNTEREEDLTNRLHADLEYLHGWSIWRDVTIVLRTFFVLNSGNAY